MVATFTLSSHFRVGYKQRKATGNFIRTNFKHSSGKHWQWDFPHQVAMLLFMSCISHWSHLEPVLAGLVWFTVRDKE